MNTGRETMERVALTMRRLAHDARLTHAVAKDLDDGADLLRVLLDERDALQRQLAEWREFEQAYKGEVTE